MKNDAGFFFPELLVNDASAEIFVSVKKEGKKNVILYLRYYSKGGSLLTNLVFGNPRKSVPLGAEFFPVPSTRRTAFVTRRMAVMSLEDFLTLISEKTIGIAEESLVTAEFALSIEPAKFVLFLACVLGWDQLTETSRSIYIRFYADREHAVMENDAGFFFPELLVNDASAEIFVSVEKDEDKKVKLHLRNYSEDGSLLTDDANLVFGNPRKSVPLGAGSFPVASTRRNAFVTRRTAVMSHEDFQTLISEKTICIEVGSETAEFALSFEPTKLVLFLACVLGWDQLTETSRSVLVPLLEREIEEEKKREEKRLKEEEEERLKEEEERRELSRVTPEIAKLSVEELMKLELKERWPYTPSNWTSILNQVKQSHDKYAVYIDKYECNIWDYLLDKLKPVYIMERVMVGGMLRFRPGHLSFQRICDIIDGKISPEHARCMVVFDRIMNGEKNGPKLEKLSEINLHYLYPSEEHFLREKGLIRSAEYGCDPSVCTVTDYERACNIIEGKETKNGCYIATAVYGSYDCPEVWTLRRFRDNTLAPTWYGRLFIRSYYALSPKLVRGFGQTEWFQAAFRRPLDRWVRRLRNRGIADTPYMDKY